MEKSFALSQLYAFITVALWSTAYVFTKVALAHFSAFSLGLVRCGVASLCLLAVLLLKREKPPAAAHIHLFLASGLAGFSLYLIAFNTGSATLSPTATCIIISLSPIITALLALILFKEKLNRRQWLATLLAFGGVVVMTLWDGAFSVSTGLLWTLAAAILVSVYNILQRTLSRRYGALGITTYSFFAGALFLTPFLPEAAAQLRSADETQLALACFLGVFPSALAYLFWGKAFAVAPKTSYVANYMFLTPFLALLLEYAILGTVPGIGNIVGGMIIILSLFLFISAKQNQASVEQARLR